jgi:hypothetical protein
MTALILQPVLNPIPLSEMASFIGDQIADSFGDFTVDFASAPSQMLLFIQIAIRKREDSILSFTSFSPRAFPKGEWLDCLRSTPKPSSESSGFWLNEKETSMRIFYALTTREHPYLKSNLMI